MNELGNMEWIMLFIGLKVKNGSGIQLGMCQGKWDSHEFN